MNQETDIFFNRYKRTVNRDIKGLMISREVQKWKLTERWFGTIIYVNAKFG